MDKILTSKYLKIMSQTSRLIEFYKLSSSSQESFITVNTTHGSLSNCIILVLTKKIYEQKSDLTIENSLFLFS